VTGFNFGNDKDKMGVQKNTSWESKAVAKNNDMLGLKAQVLIL
jgi:hypothetical protein